MVSVPARISPAPANGMTLNKIRSQPKQKERDHKRPQSHIVEARRRSGSKLPVIVRDPEHDLLGRFVVHLFGQDVGSFGSLPPMFWVGASAVGDATDGKPVDGAHSRLDSKLVALLRDAQHRLLDRFVGLPLRQEASFFGSLLPIFGVVDIRCNGHGTRPFADDRERPQGSFP